MDELIERAARMAKPGHRAVLGITGPPGAGKSTVAEKIVDALGPDTAVLLPMDGFHLSDSVLDSLARRDRKGAPDTFDVDGYVSMLQRVRTGRAYESIYAPAFDRSLEAAIAGSIPIAPSVPLVVTEGNYLLLDEGPWSAVRGLLDATWYVHLNENDRRHRLMLRHKQFGKSEDDAREWALGSDEINAARVAATKARADLIVDGV